MTKRLYIFLAIAFTLLAVGPLAGVSNQQPRRARVTPQTVETPASGNVVNVIESEFNVTLQPAQPSAGEITFVVKNQGHIPHDFRIRGNGIDQRTPMIMPQQSANMTLQLKPGTYEFECTVEGHDMAGMRGMVIVQASSG
ncbi:MAG: cupredoxin domain-containing protein [Chloroflexi bacterium]|nr:cupredoxin domain-containing protein [Chloroflexota bacterium]